MPTCESASGRFGVTFTSRTSSSRPIVPRQIGAGRRVRRQNQDSVTFFAEAQLGLAAQHARRHHAADLARGRACGRPAASRPAAPRRPCRPAAGTFGAPQTTSSSRAARHARRTMRQLVGAGVRPHAAHLGDDHAGEIAAAALDRPRPRARPSVSRSATLSASTPGLRSHELAQPVEGDLHGWPSSHRNCARKRTSFS